MKKLFAVFCFSLLLAVILSGHKSYAASASPSLYLDGTKLNPPQPSTIVNGTTFVPVRTISESLGYTVGWNGTDRSISIVSDSRSLLLRLGSAKAVIAGKTLAMPSKPLIVNNRSLLPLRFIAEQFGLQVSWDAKKNAVLLVKAPAAPVVVEPAPVPVETEKNVIQSVLPSSDSSFILAYDGDVSYSSFYLQNPDRIVIDMPNAAFANGFNGSVNADDPATFSGTIPVNGPLVKQIRYSLYDEKTSTTRFVLDLNGAATLSAAQKKELGQIVFNVKEGTAPQPTTPAPSKKFKVVIDAGHGGSDPGAISVTGKAEKTFTLAVAKKVQALLAKESGIEVLMTRTGDTYPTLNDRTNLANNTGADVFVSIHANIGPSSANGTEVYYLQNNSKTLANIMHDNIQKMVGFNDRGVKTANYHVIRESDMPSVLLEMGFLSNPSDEKKLYTDSVQQKMAEAIALSIKQFLKLA
ncbi:N-acetylmuramoyl-L-alanine amidase family protein [Cohnella candidum]|uniref:AMIN domain-containing protein n=1 Tax=Cohnella candidum TaxID=2674991 RepID=A0A3G3K4J9_9BACL|nr:N-acetylmuramoyl-L-alanine amidase family protein [Cohnella candidum]AYQ75091.1 AMIN domain-containing protein [Cohnella candidum]